MVEPGPLPPAGPPPAGGPRPWPVRAVTAFGSFWWEFLIGETPELVVGVVVVLGLVALACADHRLRTAAAVAAPLLVAAVLAASVWRAGGRRPS